jgi:hypothetical protein
MLHSGGACCLLSGVVAYCRIREAVLGLAEAKVLKVTLC